jgi:hypothetical protein
MKRGVLIVEKIIVKFPKKLIEDLEEFAGVGNAQSYLISLAENHIRLHYQRLLASGIPEDENSARLALESSPYLRGLLSPETQV